jgi:hypothetical protein
MSMEIRPETGAPAQPKPADSRSRAQAQRMGRAKATNDPSYMPPAMTNLRQARRRRDLVAMFLDACGGREAVGELTLVSIRRAAELICTAETVRAMVLNGGSNAATLDALIKIEGESRRAVRALGLKPDSAKPHVPLREQLAAEAEEAEEEPVT